MKKGLICKIFAILLVVGLLFSILPTQQAEAQAAITVCPEVGACDYQTIQAAINAASAGDTVNVAAGTYVEDVIVNKAITLQGAGMETTAIVATDGNKTPLTFSTNDATVSGFHITHEYTQTELDAWNFNNNGVTFNQFTTGNTLQNCKVTKSRNGVYINRASGNKLLGNTIENNRTGINLTNTVDDTEIKDNIIQNNWTLGIVYYSQDHVTDFSTLTISGNSFLNNWYSEILIKDAQASTGTLNVTNNIFGDSPVTYTTSADSKWNEPGHGVLKPVEFGGSATMPTNPLPTLRIYNSPGATLQHDDKVLMVGADQPYTTIQAAIDAAASGDTINVAAGNYVEALKINKSITLHGPNADISPNTETRLPEATIRATSDSPTGYPGLGMIDLQGHDLIVKIKGFDFNLEDTSNQHYRYINVVNDNRSTLYVENNIFRNAPSNSNGYWWFTDAAGPHTVTILDNHFLNAAVSNGIQWGGNSFIVDIRDNVWEDNQGWAMNFNNATGTISGNKFIDRVDNGPSWAEDQCGILVAGSGNHLSVTGNTFDGLTSDAIGLGYGFASWLDISGNTFIGTRETVDEYLYVGSTSDLTNVSIKKNSFLLDIFDEFYPGSILVNLAENWWGNPAGPDSDSFIGPVSYIPWCANEECTEFAPPVYNQTLDTYHGTIQGAIDAAGVDNTILVSPGTYNEAITLNKVGLTVQSTAGPENTFINTPAGSTKAVGFADNLGTVTFEGFTVQNFTSAGIVQGFASVGTTVNIIDNIVNPSGYYTTNLIQVVGDGSVVSGNIITASGNPYPHHEGAGNTAIMVMNGSNITITNNVINGVLPDRLGLDQAIVIWNYSAPSGTPMSNIQITGNTVTNVNWLLNFIEQDGNHKVNLGLIEKNKFTDYDAIVWDDLPRDVSRNWWGAATGPDTELFIGEGEIRYLPYCTNEECTEFSKAALYMTPNLIETTDTFTGTKTVEVFAKDVIMLTSYDLELSFDQTFIEVTAVETSEWMPGSEVAGKIIDNENGLIKIGRVRYAFQGDPVTGTGSLIKITFKPKGNLAGSSDTAFTISNTSTMVTWEYPNEGYPIPYDITGGVKVKFGSVVTNVTKQPNVSYTNLATAVTQATAEDTLRADKDFTTTAQVNVTKNLTFDTNGHTITRVNASSAYDAVFQVRTVHLTITGGGTINSTSSSGDFGAAIYMWAGNATGATVTLEDATLSGKNTSVYVTASAHSITGVIYPAVYNMTGGTVTDGIFVIRPAAELNITGGTVKGFAPIQGNGSAGMGGTKITIGGTAVIDGDDSIAIYHPQNGELIINGGTIIGTNAIEMKAGKLVVTDGTITGTGPFVETPTAISGYSTDTGDAILLFSAAGYTGDLSVDIQGGTITSDKAYALREFTTEATTRTKSIKVSDGTLNGGLGTDNADEAVFFSTVDPTVLQLTGGRYNTDPGDSPDYVYEPLDTYLHTDDYYHIMGIVAGTFEPFPADGLVIAPETITDTINYSGAIPWYNAAPTLNRVQGNRVGMKVIEPEGVDLTGATIKIYRDGIQYYTGGWNASKDAASDNFVPYWALVTNIPQDYKIVVNWNAVSEQTFFAHVLEGSTLVAPPAPIISSTDIQGYYLAGDVREFNVSMKNPDLGANYALMIFDYKLAGVTTADIDSFEYLAPPGDPRAGQWVVMTDSGYETYADCTDGTGVCGQFGWAPGGFGPVPAGFENTSKFRIKFNKGFAAPLAFTLDLSGKLDVADADWTLLTTYNGSLDVHDKPVITVVTDPYFIVNEEGKFSVTIANPATGRNYGNNVVFDLVIPGHLPADFESMSCGFGGTTWPVTLQADGNGGSITRIGGLDGFFNITAPFGPMTVNCTVTLKTSGEYSVTGKMTDTLATPELTDDRIIQTSSGEVKAYTKPTITATFPTGPIAAGVPVTVPVTITNPDGLPGPFGLVLDLPDGATIVYGGATYLCGDDPLTEDVVEVGCPVIPVDAPLTAGELVITFPGNGTVDVTIELFDTAADPDRKLADTTITDVVIGGDYAVTGYFWLQGTSRRHDIPVTFTWGGTLAPYGPTIDTEDTDTVNLTATLTYGGEYLITTNQPRYLNVTAGLGKTFEVKGQTSLNSLRLLAGNAIWLDNVIDNKDSGHVGAGYNDGIAARPDADVNFDGRINIQDLALVGGNYGLDSDVYDSWVVVTP